MKRSAYRQGFSLVEILVVVAIIGLVVSVTIPNLNAYRRRAALRAAAREIMSELRQTRSEAIARGRNVGVKFSRSSAGDWLYSVYEDGDFDGIKREDIERGDDPLLQHARPVLHATGGARIGLPERPVRDPDSGRLLRPNTSPVKFAASLCAFSVLGGGTAGSIYLTDGHDNVAIVRVAGATGRVRLLFYDAASRRWS